MLFFRTNMDRTEQWDCSYYLQFAHSVETLTRKFSGQRVQNNNNKKNKLATKMSRKHPEADWSGVWQTLTGLHWKKGITASAWGGGFNNDAMGGGGWKKSQREAVSSHSQAPGEMTPPPRIKTNSITDFNSLLLCFVWVILFFFFQVLSGSASIFEGFGATTRFSSLASDYKYFKL